MFEHDGEIVEVLLKENADFKRLYDKYSSLKRDVDNGNAGSITIKDMELEGMKKEKLFLKDQMTLIIEEYRRDQAT